MLVRPCSPAARVRARACQGKPERARADGAAGVRIAVMSGAALSVGAPTYEYLRRASPTLGAEHMTRQTDCQGCRHFLTLRCLSKIQLGRCPAISIVPRHPSQVSADHHRPRRCIYTCRPPRPGHGHGLACPNPVAVASQEGEMLCLDFLMERCARWALSQAEHKDPALAWSRRHPPALIARGPSR